MERTGFILALEEIGQLSFLLIAVEIKTAQKCSLHLLFLTLLTEMEQIIHWSEAVTGATASSRVHQQHETFAAAFLRWPKRPLPHQLKIHHKSIPKRCSDQPFTPLLAIGHISVFVNLDE